MKTNRTGSSSFIVIGLLFFGFIFFSSSHDFVLAKSQNSTVAQTNKPLKDSENVATKEAEIETGNQIKQNSQKNINSETHRSVVASFVKSLLSVADRESGIGKQVREIAQQQNSLKEITSDAIENIDKRSKLKSFLLGTDYKNIGALRSQMVKTRNQIEQLRKLTEKAKSKKNIEEIQSQIKILEQEQQKINSFITQNESKFSLLGWAAKLFVK